jgi:hypothetical protein
MRVYEAQRLFLAETGRYARSLGKLGIEPGNPPIIYRRTLEGFEASAATTDGGRRIVLGADSRLTIAPGQDR